MKKAKVVGGARKGFEVKGDPYKDGFREALKGCPECFGLMELAPPRSEGTPFHNWDRGEVQREIKRREADGKDAGLEVVRCLNCPEFNECALVTLVGKTSSIRAKVKRPNEDE